MNGRTRTEDDGPWMMMPEAPGRITVMQAGKVLVKLPIPGRRVDGSVVWPQPQEGDLIGWEPTEGASDGSETA